MPTPGLCWMSRSASACGGACIGERCRPPADRRRRPSAAGGRAAGPRRASRLKRVVSHPIDPWRLLEQAEELAGVDAGPGRPKTANHRRPVSAAYYALFHDITLKAARHVLPDDASDGEIWQTTRWIEHGDVRWVCVAIEACGAARAPTGRLPEGLKQSAEPLWTALSKPGPEGGRTADVSVWLRMVAVAFIALHAGRQSADYDHLAEFSKETAIGEVQGAAFALEVLRDHATDPALSALLRLGLCAGVRISAVALHRGGRQRRLTPRVRARARAAGSPRAARSRSRGRSARAASPAPRARGRRPARG